jgi:hypothetical protein
MLMAKVSKHLETETNRMIYIILLFWNVKVILKVQLMSSKERNGKLLL